MYGKVLIKKCEVCIMGKQHQLPFGKNKGKRTTRPLELVHSDICGSITPTTWDGKQYFLSIIDDYTHFAMVYLLTHKSEAVQCLQEYEALITAKFNQRISRLKCDNGGEYTSKKFIDFCKSKGIKIKIKYTVPYTPQLNGVAERYNRMVLEKARCMVLNATPDKIFWGEAVQTATYLCNRNKQIDLSNLRVFGCLAYAYMPNVLRSKLDPNSRKCIMVGYAVHGYRLWDIEEEKIITARDVVFKETDFLERKSRLQSVSSNSSSDNEKNEKSEEVCQEKERRGNEENEQICDSSKKEKHTRIRKAPESHAEVSKKVIGNKWVYKIKTDEKGTLTKYKARLVAREWVRLSKDFFTCG